MMREADIFSPRFPGIYILLFSFTFFFFKNLLQRFYRGNNVDSRKRARWILDYLWFFRFEVRSIKRWQRNYGVRFPLHNFSRCTRTSVHRVGGGERISKNRFLCGSTQGACKDETDERIAYASVFAKHFQYFGPRVTLYKGEGATLRDLSVAPFSFLSTVAFWVHLSYILR